MPIGFGVMLKSLFTVYQTSIVLDSISPSPAYFGDATTFNVIVSNNTVGGPDPTGQFEILDVNTNTVLVSGTLNDKGIGVAISTLSFGPIKLVARYLGVNNLFAPSQTAIIKYGLQPETTSINIIYPSSGHHYCYAAEQEIIAEVTSGKGLPVTVGSVSFRLYTTDTQFLEISSSDLDGYGKAIISIPSNTTLAGNVNYLQAIYNGYDYYNISKTPSGTSGLLLVSSNNDLTNISISVEGSSTFSEKDSITVIGTVTATNLSNPSDGYVEFSAEDGYVFSLGTSIPVNGVASLYVPGNTFTSGGTWTLYAQYFSDTVCYQNSSQDSIRIFPT